MVSASFNLQPAKWIWYPSQRCLQNTFVFFRRVLNLPSAPQKATGWILADSRYRLHVNGKRVQWGPAPCDPRWMEADPIDLTDQLQAGENAIGCEVLFYGRGDGTWPLGKPGFIFRLDLEFENGETLQVVSDGSWQSMLARCWQPGHYTRWYLRALQEEFDARLYPDGWCGAGYEAGADWLEAMELDCPADKPPICSSYEEYMLEMRGDSDTAYLSPRCIPLIDEPEVQIERLTESMWIQWNRSPQEYFESLTPDSFKAERNPCAKEAGPGAWKVQLDGKRGAALTFELKEQLVGWPYFTIEAPEGTVVELMVHEAHEPGGPALLNTHYHSWSRFICKEGVNTFETFDYESFRWLQLHIHGAEGEVTIRNAGARRRIYPWPDPVHVECSDPDLQMLLNASVNTLNNSATDIIVDGMARERQQYSGDCGHQIHAIYLGFGETRLPSRFLKSYSQGITEEGYFLDCWPAYDRLCRFMERQLNLTKWGPILDHGIGFVFDNYHHYLYTGDLKTIEEPFPRLIRSVEYLKSRQLKNGLLPVEDIGTPCVWLDHEAYPKERYKQCPFNLYAAAMLQHALAPLCQAFGDSDSAAWAFGFGRELLEAVEKNFWDKEHGIFMTNLPWRHEEGADRFCDRSLATAILFDQCPDGNIEAAIKRLVDCPQEMGFSYPANAGWRLWALAKTGHIDTVLHDFRTRWTAMDSIRLNNTLQEDWVAKPDTTRSEWSHCPLSPLYIFYMSVAGIRPLEPGFKRCAIRPQLGDLEKLTLTARTVQGPIRFQAQGPLGNRRIAVSLPAGCSGELIVSDQEKISLESLDTPVPKGHRCYQLPPGTETELMLTAS